MNQKFVKLTVLFLFIFTTHLSTLFAQVPAKMSYQAVIRNSSDQLIINQKTGVRISILQGSSSGVVVYTETHTPTSNSNGLVNFEIGSGNPVNGSFSTIDWSESPFFLKTETDPSGGTNYSISGVSELLATPFSLYAQKAETVKNETDPSFNSWDKSEGIVIAESQISDLKHFTNDDETDPQYHNSTAKGITPEDTARWNGKSEFDGNYNSLSSKPVIPSSTSDLINNSGFLTATDITDNDPTNELQVLGISNDSIYLTKGGSIKLPARFSGKYADLSGKPTNISEFVNDAGYQPAVDDGDTDSENELQMLIGEPLYKKIGITNGGGWLNMADIEADPIFRGSASYHINSSGSGDVISYLERTKLNDLNAADLHDKDKDTKIYVEKNLDEDIIRFNLAGTEKWVMDGSRLEPKNNGNSVFIGTGAGMTDDLTDNRNIFIGDSAGFLTTSGRENIAIGADANYFNQSGSFNTIVGNEAGKGTSSHSSTGNVFLGYRAGFNETGNNKLYIENSDTILPLVYGEFDHDKLQVNGNLTVRGAGATDGEFVSVFENTAGGNGDGIKIKLGKASANNGIPDFNLGIDPADVQKMLNLIDCSYSGNKITLLGEIVAVGVAADVQMIGGLAVGVGNLVTGFINTNLHLPLNFPYIQVVPNVTVFPGFHLGMPSIAGVGIPDVNISSESIGPYGIGPIPLLPAIPDISLSAIGIPAIPITDLDFWGVPNICFTDNVPNPLNNNNEFIQFADHNNVQMGAIKAQSVANWVTNYLNPLFLISLHGALTSTLDKKHARYHFKGEITKALKAYPKIGVEYTSGNGDYAEWLERLDANEAIGSGDIVAVKSGKITKKLDGAEQVMAISHKPIVLGNVPPQEKEHLGNNVAFMGQIPVKVMGPVNTGDYIVGNSKILGYGVAVNPENMTVENFKMAVGRAWESNSEKGPLTINTVIGVHNAAYINILKQYEQKIKTSEKRLESLESRIEWIESEINKGN